MTFSALPSTTEAYFGQHTAGAQNAAAYYDANGNGILDGITAANDVPFPGFPSVDGTITGGRGYAQPSWLQSNLVLSLQPATGVWAAVHFSVEDGSITPVQVLVGDFQNGPVLVQDVSLNQFNVTGELPIGASSGFLQGTTEVDPFFYDGIDNEIFGNHVSIDFNVALLNDA